ncbi:hypothetical protein CgunFtcFv8_013807 [Champsocephalus gunnari]|uniref:Uncharacterized protein n=1 Tax=Champsocephalus gunnari TaxID=52237 RepID=A0AAN8E849_CHAGU|nr:hypothetical protein CgunFtcFv8_013807 [Champsocephalus gunnari]
MAHRVQTNNTTLRDGARPELNKLDSDTFQCPFCERTGSHPGLMAHLQSHQRSLVKYGGCNVYKCHLKCVASSTVAFAQQSLGERRCSLVTLKTAAPNIQLPATTTTPPVMAPTAAPVMAPTAAPVMAPTAAPVMAPNGRSSDGPNGRSSDGPNGRSSDGPNGRSSDGPNGRSSDGRDSGSSDGRSSDSSGCCSNMAQYCHSPQN